MIKEYKLPPFFADTSKPDTNNLVIHVGQISIEENEAISRGGDFGANTLYVHELAKLRSYDWSLITGKEITLLIDDEAYRRTNKQQVDSILFSFLINQNGARSLAIVDVAYPELFTYREATWHGAKTLSKQNHY